MKIKKEFNFDDYKENYVMNCKTEEEARQFCKLMHEDGRRWNSGESYIKENRWSDCKENICYSFNEGKKKKKKWYKDTNYTILEWSNFTYQYNSFTKADLKDGMIVELRNGDKAIFLNNKFMIESRQEYLLNQDYNEDLTRIKFESGDIIAVYKSTADTLNDYFSTKNLIIIWKREDGLIKETEMSIKQIKEKLGIEGELKIIE